MSVFSSTYFMDGMVHLHKRGSEHCSFLSCFLNIYYILLLYRISLAPGCFPPNSSSNSTCVSMSDLSTQLAGAASGQIYRNQLNTIFKFGSSIHSILSDAADEVICSGMLHQSLQKCPVSVRFFGFETIWERLYVILMVTFFSVALFLLLLVLIIFSEDRKIKKEFFSAKRSHKKKMETENNSHCYGSNLLEPIGEAKSISSYVEYRDTQKRHDAGDRVSEWTSSAKDSINSPVRNSVSRKSHGYFKSNNHGSEDVNDENEDENGRRKVERLRRVTQTEDKLEELAEF